jgi:PAS domain S-box-containing protein
VTITEEVVGVVLLAVALLGLGLFVLLQNPRAAVNRRFTLSTFIISGWIVSISAALSASEISHTIVLGRLGFAFASAIPFSLLTMFVSFGQGGTSIYARWKTLLPAVFCAAFVFLSLSPWIVAGARPGSPKANFIYGPAHPLFGAYFLLSFASALYTLWKTMRATSGLQRLQLRYLLLGILLGGAGAITTNLLVPILFGTSRYSALGPYFSLLVVSFSAHAIIRYRLMDIRVVIQKGVVYFCAIVASSLTFVAVIRTIHRLSGYAHDSVPLGLAVSVAVVIAVLFQPLKEWLLRSINRYFYRESYDYHRTIREASRRLSTILDLNPLLDYLQTAIENIFRTEAVIVYLRDLSGGSFAPRLSSAGYGWPPGDGPLSIAPTSSLVAFLQRDRRTLVREESMRDPQDLVLAEAGDTLARIPGDLALPLTEDATLVGFIVVGAKRSGDPFFAEDIDLLETLVAQASVATKNARLYHHVVRVNDYIDNILSTMDSGVIAVDANGQVSLFNPAAEKLLGLTAHTILGRQYSALPSMLAAHLQNTLATTTPKSQFELSIPGADDRDTPLICSTATLTSRDDSSLGALIVFSNLSRVKELEREKRRSERLASFGALASGVAHEIKNPLVAIRTFAELLPERYSDEEFREDFSKVVVREIARIDDLVARLRGLAANVPKRIGRVDIREPIRDTLALLRAQFEQTRTRVVFDCDHSAPFVAVDEAQLKQLFLNLLLNALEAMGTGGAITLRVLHQSTDGTRWIVTHVTDTGPGIPDSIRANVFDPFFTTKPRGSGLGLAICRGIADAHRGTIRADRPMTGRGTVISVSFPAADNMNEVVDHTTSTLPAAYTGPAASASHEHASVTSHSAASPRREDS